MSIDAESGRASYGEPNEYVIPLLLTDSYAAKWGCTSSAPTLKTSMLDKKSVNSFCYR